MKPVIAIIGRPNVGKSTLFNVLTRSRDALVADQPGFTRDRLYGEGKIGERPHLVVDTGGIGATSEVPDADTLKALMLAQTRQAMAEADAILFLLDARAGLNPADRDIAEDLRRLRTPVFVVVNKTEGLDPHIASAEFHALGLGEPVPISAAHGQGVATLMQQVLRNFPPEESEPEPQAQPRIAVVGRPNVGKSTLVNAMLGEERVVVFDQPGTTRDSIRIPFERSGKSYILIDTAGMRRRGRIDNVLEKYSVIKSLQAIDEANVVILVLDARQQISEQDATLAGYILDQGRSLILAVNKWDGLDEGARAWIKREAERKFPFLNFSKPHFISALHGTNVSILFPAVDRAFTAARKNLATPGLNRVLAKAVQAVPPPMARGRRIKLKLAHQGGKNPPLIIIHGNQVKWVPDSYRRYLENTFRKAFKLEGTPVRIEFRQGENPYAGRKDGGRQKKIHPTRKRQVKQRRSGHFTKSA